MTDRGDPPPAPSPSYGLSPLQEGMLFEVLLRDPAGKTAGFDIEQLEVELGADIEPALLQRAFTLVVNRHAALASRFHWSEGAAPVQSVAASVEVPVEVEDFGALEPAAVAATAGAFLARDRARGFRLGEAPLHRVTVLRALGRARAFVWTFHHIVLDGHSFAPVLAEVFQAYAALERREPVELPAAPRPFRDFIDWLALQDSSAGRAYFRELLRDKTPTPLPGAEPGARRLAATGCGTVTRSVSPELGARIDELARRSGTTPNTVLQAAWAVVLARFTGEEDVVFGAARHGRGVALGGEARHMIGLFTNTVPVRARLDQAATVTELLR
ncbi:MAG TPA: condensation domain-containing protein, partial [Polyangiaceae bacterium]|nr:condensation domain-containing protein [Polyangiaceae bacterium]